MASCDERDEDFISLLLVGKTGYGKSSTGNSILGQKKFKVSGMFTSSTKKCQREVARVGGRPVRVVDSPGLADTDIKTADGTKQLEMEVEDILTTHPDGFDAILTVIRYDQKLTEEDKLVFNTIDALSGKGYVNQFGILIITRLDSYDPKENDNLPFETFVKTERGLFREMLNECNNHMVCFDNKTKNEEIRKKQVKQLVDMVTKIKQIPQRYSFEIFEKAQKSRDAFYLQQDKPTIKANTVDKLKIIFQDITSCRDIHTLEQDKIKLSELRRELIEQDKGTNTLTDIISDVSNVETQLMEAIGKTKSNNETKEEFEQLKGTIASLEQKLDKADKDGFGLLEGAIGTAVGVGAAVGTTALAATPVGWAMGGAAVGVGLLSGTGAGAATWGIKSLVKK